MMSEAVNHRVWESLYRQGHRLSYPGDMFVRVTHRLLSPDRHARVLDYGCGSGENLMHLCRRGFKMTGLEVSASAVRTTRERLEASGLEADVIHCTEGVLPFEGGRFDAVIAWQVLCYNDETGFREALSELHRILRPGGVFLAAITAPGDSRQVEGKPLGSGVYRLTTPGQTGAVLRVVDREEMSRYFDLSKSEIGVFSHEFMGVSSRHWVVCYEK